MLRPSPGLALRPRWAPPRRSDDHTVLQQPPHLHQRGCENELVMSSGALTYHTIKNTSFFSHAFFLYSPLLLPPSRHSDPGSHMSRLFSPPARSATLYRCLAFLSRERFSTFFPC